MVLGFQAQAASGSSLDPADVQITNAAGAVMPLRYNSSDSTGNTQSVVLAALPLGNYTLTVAGNDKIVGAFQLNVFLAGDVDGNSTVNTTDGSIIRSLLGSTVGDGKYQVAADSNLDGVISSFDYTQWRANLGAATAVRTLSITEGLPSGLYLLPNGTPVTANSTIAISGQTNAGATVDLATGSDNNYDEGQTNANGSGTYSLTSPALVNGLNTLRVRATDSFGQQAFASVNVDLDTQAPTITLTSPTSPLTTNTNVTLTGQVTDNLSGTASLQASVDNGAYQAVSFDAQGNFSFTTALALDGSADGQHTVRLRATDNVGNVSSPLAYSFTLKTTQSTLLVEGSSLLSSLDQTFTVPSVPSVLEFQYSNLHFDLSPNFVNDAFEASLTDANGNSLVLPIAGSGDAFLNITAGQSPVLSPNAQLNNGTVDLDLSHIAPGTQAHLQVRLIDDDDDSDTTTSSGSESVEVTDAQVISESLNTPDAVTPAAPPVPSTTSIDFSSLSDVTSSITANYGQTEWNQQSNVLSTNVALSDTGTYPVDAPLIAVVENLSDPSVRVRGSDGTTSDGLPYFILSGGSMSGNTLTVGQTTGTRTLAFYDPNGVQFTYDLKVLGQLNRPPAFTSEPNTQAIPGLPYQYQATAADPDHDPLTFSLLVGPKGMTVNPTTGAVTWTPQQSDLGNETVLLQVDDGHGGTAQQQYTLSTIVTPPDRPPLFTSTPVITGYVDTAYQYQATATDPDDDPLTFSLTSAPAGMSINAKTGLATWTPDTNQLGTDKVTLTVADGRGGTATQSYAITVLPTSNDQPPLITSNPVTQYNVPPASNPPNGTVNPSSVQLTLANGQTSSQTLSASDLSGGPLALGSLATGNFGTPGQQDVYTFTLTANALLYFDSLTDNPYFAWSLNGPAGNVVSDRQFIASDGNSKENPVLALPSGSYTLTVLETDPGTLSSQLLPLTSVVGNYSFRLSNLATAAPIKPGTPFSGTLNPGDSTNFYQFTAGAGQNFYFASLLDQGGSDYRDGWRLIDPFGNSVFNLPGGFNSRDLAFLGNDGGRLTLPFTGTYTVLVEGYIAETNPVKYTLNVIPITDTTQALTLGSTVNGDLASPGQQDTYTFNLTNNSLLYFDSLTDNTNFQWSLTGPPGTVVSNRSFTSSDIINGGNPALVLPAGAYTLTVSAVAPTNGPYSFRLSDTAAAPILTPGTPVNVTLNPGDSTTLYQFSATAGQSFYFAGISYTHGGGFDNWQLLDPYGNVLFSTSPENDGGRLTLTATGDYTLLIEGGISDTTTPSFSFNVAPITDTKQSLTLGNTVNGTLADPGQQDTYTFNLAANALLYFDALTNNAGLQWSLSGPGGTAVSNRSFTATDGFSFGGYTPGNADPVLSLPAGAYTLTVSGTGQTAGAYSFRLSALSTAATLPVNTTVNGTLTPANSTNLYQFTGNAGDTYQFTTHAGTSLEVWRLIGPYGNVVAGNLLVSSSGPATLLATGTYYLLVEGYIGDTGTANYSITAQFQGNTPPTPPSGTPLTLGATVSGNLTTASQQDTYTFTLPTNALLYFDSLSASGLTVWSLSGPGGTAVSNRSFAASDSGEIAISPALALPAGAYTLTVHTIDGAVGGAYGFRLDNLASATVLTPGTAVSDTLNPANSTNLYQFNGTAGQSFYFANLSGSSSNSIWWRLIDPYGNQLFSTSLTNDGGRLALTANGTYTVLVEGIVSNTGTLSYSFNVDPITDTTQTLALGSLVNGNLAAPGQHDTYTFNLATNALLYFDSLTNNAGFHWSLTGPGGTVVNNRSFTNSDGINISGDPALALPAGAYTLQVTGTGQTTGAYAFRLSNLATATQLSPGTAVSGTLNPANSTNFYQFNASAGKSFYFADLSGSGSARWRLIDPYGNVLFSNALSTDGGRLNLTASGTYTVLIEGAITDTGTDNYSFNVFPITDTTQTLTLGSTVNGNITDPGQQGTYSFTLASASQLYFDSLTNSSSIQWTLSGPPGFVDWSSNALPDIVYNRHFNNSDGNAIDSHTDPVLSLPAGTYTLVVNAIGQTTGAYGFRLVNLAGATLLTPGTPVSSTLNPANGTDLYQFSAQAGQSVYFAHLSGGTGNTWWRLIDPNGNMLFSTAFTNDGGRLTLAIGGTYTLLIEGGVTDAGTVSYSFNVAPITDPTQTLTLGSLVNASLGSPGEQDHYTFTLAANTLVYFDALTNNSAFEWSLSGPAGAIVSNLAFTASDANTVGLNPVHALPAGSYALTVFGTGQTTGAYAFRLSDLTQAAPLTPGDVVNGALTPANSTQLYQFNAAAGQSFYFADISAGGGSSIWRLIDPYGDVLFDVGLFSDAGRVTLNATGTYTLLIEGAISNTGTVNYSFNVAPITDPTQSLTLGGLVNSTLAAPGELDHYTFSLANNALLYFDSLTNNSSFQWSLSGPDGAAASNRSFTNSDGGSVSNPVLALPAGNYTLTVSATGQTTGAYAFRLSDLSTATALTLGTPISGTLNPANSSNFYRFSANAGDEYTFVPQGISGIPDADWRLIDPYGNVLFDAGLRTNEGPLTLAATGTYYLLIEGATEDTGSGTYTFNVQFDGNAAPIFSGTPLTLGTTVNGNLTVAGQQDRYIFTLAAHAQLYFDSLTNNSNIQWSLSGPVAAVNNRPFSASDAGAVSNPALELPAGNYTLTVSGSGQTTGAYAFRLDDMASATKLTPGTPVSGSLVPTNSTNLYQFQATAGEPFYFARLSGSGGASGDHWQLIDPYGKVVFSTFLYQDAGRITLTAAGTYTLLVEGAISDTGTESYSFNVVPITDVTQSLALGSLINGTLAAPGQQDSYSFNLSANALLYFDSLTNNNNLQWSLTGPGGNVVFNRSFNDSDAENNSDPLLALTAGNYVLTIDAPQQITGPYSFRLSNLASATPVGLNTEVSGTLNPANSTRLYQFTGNAGDSYYFESLKIPFALSGSASTADWRLVDPYGNILFTENLGSDGGSVTLPTTGTYTLLIEGGILNPVQTGYAFRIDQPQVDVAASDPNAPFVDQTGPVANISSPSFNVQFAGNGQAQGFDVQFVSPATNIILASIPVSIDTSYLYQVRAVDPQGYPLTYSLTQAPTGMTIDPTTGLITWVPTAAQVGQNSVTVQVEDTHGGTDTQSFTVTVTSETPGSIQGTVYNDENGDGQRDGTGNSPPPPPTGPFALAGTPFPGIGVDKEPAIIITIGPDGALTTTNTGIPPYDSSDDTYVGVINEANSGVALQALQLTNDLVPIFGFDGDGIGTGSFTSGASNEGKTGYEGPGTYYSDINGATTTGTVNFDDGLGDGLEPGLEAYFSLEGVPGSITPTIVQQALPANLEPGLAGVTVYLDLNHTGQLEPNDPETQTDALGHYFFSNLAPGTYTVAEVTQADLQQTAPPNGTYTAVVQSEQVTSGLDFGNEILTNVVPHPPTITSTAPTTAAAGQTYRYTVSVSNPDDDVLSFDLPVKPDGMVVDALTGTLDWEPTDSELGPQNVVLRLTDNKGGVVLQSFTVQVDEESPPVITSTPPTQPAQTGLPYQYQVQAQDAQNDPLTYSLLQAPSGMTIDPNSGLLSWVGPQVGPGLPSGYSVTIQAANPFGGTDTQTYTVFVITPGFDQPPVITSHPPQSIPPAPPGQPGTPLYYQVIATSPSGNPLTYSLPVAPTGMTISSNGLLKWVATVNDVGSHPVTIQVEDSRGLIVTQSFTINVTYNYSNPEGPAITSTPAELARSGLDYEYDAAANDPGNVPVIWSLDTAPAGMSVNALTGTVRWTPTLAQLGSANVVLRATDTDGAYSTQSFTITVVSGNIPPNIVSTPSTQGTVGQLYTYAVKAEDEENNPLTYTLVSAPAGMVIDPSTGLVQWAPTASQIGTQSVVINVSDGQGGSAVQGYNIVVSSTAGSQPPTISSMPALLATAGQPYSYQVLAADPQGESLRYSLINAPTGMTIDPSSGLVQWTLAATQLGSSPVLLAVTNTAGLIATQNFAITVQPPNQPPVIKSSPVTTGTAGAAYEYDVMAVDPDGDSLTYTLTTAPAGMTIDSLGRITWSPQIADIGNQTVDVSVSDGRGSTVSQSFTVAVVADTEPPNVLLTLSSNPVDLGTPDLAVVTATDNVGVTALTLTVNGTPVPLDSMGQATLPDNTAGDFTVVAAASDAAGNVGTDSQTLVVINPQVTTAPVVAITTPADNGMVTAPTQVTGTVQDPNLVSYTLSVALIGSQNFTTISTGTSQVNNGVLGTFDPTMLQDGSYDLRLIATNTGGLSSEADVTVNVSGILKLGNFTVSFTDLTVPLAGIPITVTRTYDSLTANQSGDFGYGWRLEFRDTQLQTSVPSTGEEADDIFNSFQFGTHVYITLPGSPREGFTFEPTPAPGLLGGFLGVLEPAFVPDPGVKDTLTVPSADLTVASDGSLEDYSTDLPYNPASPIFGNLYTLTTSQGLVYSINASTGEIDSVTNADNDTLTFTDSGVASSSGASITFQRDAQGRIAAITDPTGEKILYQYDANGNLAAVTDRSNNTTKFVYLSTPAHYLSQVIDPLGRTGIRTNYDANGRLDELIDANGNPVKMNYDLAASTETITDQLGNPTTYEYDAQGNIIEQIDALGGITRRTFDANNDMLTETDPMGRTTTFTYDSRGDVLTKTDPMGNTTLSDFQTITFGTKNLFGIQTSAPFTVLTASTDPLGNTTSFAVNAQGVYTSTTDPLGNTISETMDPSGNPASVTYPDGSTVQYTYDNNGDLLSATDALGNQTTYTYDADGNRLTSTTTVTGPGGSVQTLTTTTAYDAQGRVIAVTDPDGNVTRTEYDANGNKIATIDPLGNETQYVYDADNRLIKTIYPDGSTTQSEYDADGHVTATIDQLGRKTQYQYDALGRLIKTIYPDGSSTETKYDADGEVIATTDRLGNTTTYRYDADGNQIAQTDPLGHSTTTTYDADGRAVAQTDPLGNTTKTIYNAAGEPIENDYLDGTKSTTTYDAEGRVVSKTDQLGRTTSYEYDADGRLIVVTDPLGNKTTYTYDQLGHQITSTTTQTAADGSVRTLTTQTEYDNLGRVIAVIDPDGDVTRTEYNADGNVTETINPLGQVAKYVYNSMNRLIETINPDGTHTEIEYDAAGEKIATIDELGRETQYQYDSLGRLIETIYPDGSSTQTQYDADGHVIAQIDELGNRTQFQYDADGRLAQAADALGNKTGSTYDADGDKTSETDALGHTTHYVYDVMGRRIETDYPDGTKTTNTYDADGELIATTDQLGRTTLYEYDADGRQIAVIDPLGQTTQYAYDEQGDLIRKTDANGDVTTYEYDGEGRQIAIFLPALPGQAPFESTTKYDADGNVVGTTDYDGNTIQYVYDARDRLIAEDYPGGTSVTYTYTLTGQVATVTDSRGTTVYTYDLRDRLLSCTEPDGTTISYTYDADGDCTSETTPAGTTSYTFDALGQELTVTDPNGGVTSYTYDAAGNLIRTVFSNGIVETRSYDDLNRLTFLQDVSGSTVIASYTYTLGPTGLIDQVVENTGRTVVYTYDALNRLTEEKITDPVHGDRTIDYTYDAVGNRLTMKDSALGLTVFTYDAMDRLTTSTLAGQVTDYTYDKNGNLLTEVSPTQALFYQYDFDNRLIAAGANGVTNETNEYDADGNLVSQTINGQETRFLIDTVHQYAQIVMEYSPGSTIKAAYVYGDSLIGQTRGGVQSFYLVDALGSTRELTNAAGNVTDRYIYDAFGRILFQSGTTVNPYLFAGQRTDPITGLDYLRARYYDPALGRFTSADPLRQVTARDSSFQFYVYAQNDPVNRIDPSGLEDIADFEIASAVSGVIDTAVIGAGIGGTLGFIRGGVSGGLKGLIGGFVSGLLLGGALAIGAGLAEALGGTVAATSFSATTTIGLTGYGLYNAGKDLYNAKSGTDVGAAFFELLTTVIGATQGVRVGGGEEPAVEGGDTPEVEQDLQTEADATGEPIDKTSPGPEGNSNYVIGPDPVTGGKEVIVQADELEGSFADENEAAPSVSSLPEVKNLGPNDTLVIMNEVADDAVTSGTFQGVPNTTLADLQSISAFKSLENVGRVIYINLYQGVLYANVVK